MFVVVTVEDENIKIAIIVSKRNSSGKSKKFCKINFRSLILISIIVIIFIDISFLFYK